MAKMFYTAAEAAQKIGVSVDDLKGLVREGALREFRDAGDLRYKVDDVNALVKDRDVPSASASASGEILLEPAEEEAEVSLEPAGGDILALEDSAGGSTAGGGDTASGSTAERKAQKEDTAVPSVGINIFDDDDLDEMVDPLAQTAVTDLGGLGADGSGSGSGILELTREESDDTSLGSELLEEIYTGEEQDGVEMGEATRAGLEEAVSEEPEPVESDEEPFRVETEGIATGPAKPAVVGALAEPASDPLSTGITAAMVVASFALWFAGLAGVALIRGISPAMLKTVYANLALYGGGALGVAVIAAVVTFGVARRGS